MSDELPLPRGINHIGITVPDLDAATTFLKEGLGAKVAYDGLTSDDEPRCGAETEQQLGLPKGARIRRQRMVVAGTGASLEMFEIDGPHQPAAGLADYGLNHLAFYVDDIQGSLERLVAAGGRALSGVHANSRYEDTPGNGSVYVLAPWAPSSSCRPSPTATTTPTTPRPRCGPRPGREPALVAPREDRIRGATRGELGWSGARTARRSRERQWPRWSTSTTTPSLPAGSSNSTSRA